jgi:hypothetical protein
MRRKIVARQHLPRRLGNVQESKITPQKATDGFFVGGIKHRPSRPSLPSYLKP